MGRSLTYQCRTAAQLRTFYIPEMTLFELPQALRQRIYEQVLCEKRNTVPLLQTCRQILAEAQPLVLDTPITFQSQYDLVEYDGDCTSSSHLTNLSPTCSLPSPCMEHNLTV